MREKDFILCLENILGRSFLMEIFPSLSLFRQTFSPNFRETVFLHSSPAVLFIFSANAK